jgi:hypothetical protein
MPAAKKHITYEELVESLKTVTEAQALALLKEERKGPNRPSFVRRSYGKYSMLREKRERTELLSE